MRASLLYLHRQNKSISTIEKTLVFCCIFFFITSCSTQKPASSGGNISNEISWEQDKTLEAHAQRDSILIERNFIDGCAAKAVGDYDKAIAFFKEIIKTDENNAAALYELAKIYFEYGRMDDAKELARIAAEEEPSNEYYQLLYGDILFYMLNYHEAAQVYETILQKFPTHIDNYYQLSYIYEKDGEIEKSIEVLKKIEDTFGSDESLLTELQRLYQKNGNFAEAETILLQLSAEHPEDISYYYMLAELYHQQNNKLGEEKMMNNILQADPENADILLRKAQQEKQAGNISEFCKYVRKAFSNANASIDTKIFFIVSYIDSIEQNNFYLRDSILAFTTLLTQVHPADAKVYSLKGDFLYYSKAYSEARINYRKSLNLRTDVYDVWVKLFYIDSELRNYDSLLAVTNQSIEYYPNQPLGYYFQGIAYMDLQKNNEAIQVLKRALPLSSSNVQLKADVYLRLGDAYNDLKNYTESDNAYEASLAINPKNPYALNNYAYHLTLRNEHLEKAAEMAKSANMLVPDNASLLDTYAWVLYKQQKYSESKIYLEKALKAGGEKSEVVMEHYGDILFQTGEKDAAVDAWKKAKSLGKGSEWLDKKINDRMLYE